ncbi:hypothetical protein Tco_0369914 [Tanacetum coccineum]
MSASTRHVDKGLRLRLCLGVVLRCGGWWRWGGHGGDEVVSGAADGEGGEGWCCGGMEMVDVVEWQRGGEMMTMRWRGRRRLVLWWDGDGGRGGVAAGWGDDDDGGVDGGDDVGCGGWMAGIRVTAPKNKEREER